MRTDRRSARSSIARIFAARQSSPGSSTVVLTLSLSGRLGVTARSVPYQRRNGNTANRRYGYTVIRVAVGSR